MHKYKTPQEVFVLLLEQWDRWSIKEHEWSDGICLKLNRLKHMDIINYKESRSALDYMELYHQEAIDDFEANPNIVKCYWWPTEDQKIRKQFVKFLSEQP